MSNLADVKREMIDHMYGLDKAKMSVADLKTYAEILRIMVDLDKADRNDKWIELMQATMSSGFGPQYKAAEVKKEV